jgi:hypothetical protein
VGKLFQRYLDNLEEGKRTSRIVVTRQTKIKRAIGQLASKEAKDKGDPLYDKMIRYRDLFYKYKDMIHKKYGPRVRSKARR